jgi:hypothetical protein
MHNALTPKTWCLVLALACTMPGAGCAARQAGLKAQVAGLEAETAALRAQLATQEQALVALEARTLVAESERAQWSALMDLVAASWGSSALRRPAATGEGPPPTSSATRSQATALRCEQSEGRYAIDGMPEPEGLTGSARIIPHYRDGVAAGFKLYGIRPDSLFASCGFMNGDTITSINGTALLSADAALEAYQMVQTSGTAVIELQRRGSAMVVEVTGL